MKNIKLKSITFIALALIFILGSTGCIITITEPETPGEPTQSTTIQTPVVPIDPGWTGSIFVMPDWWILMPIQKWPEMWIPSHLP